jgi:ABC-type Fe3+ transport system permease subunit
VTLGFIAIGIPKLSVWLAAAFGNLAGETIPADLDAAKFAFGSAFISMIVAFLIAWAVSHIREEGPELKKEFRRDR